MSQQADKANTLGSPVSQRKQYRKGSLQTKRIQPGDNMMSNKRVKKMKYIDQGKKQKYAMSH